MKLLRVFLIILAIENIFAEDSHSIILGTDYSTIDGVKLSSESLYGVTEENSRVLITEPGLYVLSGEYNGQVKVKLSNPDEDEATLLLNGVTITNSNGPGVLITKAREIDATEYSRTNSISYNTASSLDFTHAGIKIILADDSINVVNASHEDGHDAAFFSKVSMVISGETKGNGILTVIGDTEGLDTKKHLLIEGGIVKISAQDDGINTNHDYGSVVMINGGKVLVNGGCGSEGDGIDSNGMIIINGGEVISSSKPQGDSGLDSNSGLIINGGKVIGTGSSMDGADEGCGQPSMNLIFGSQVGVNSVLVVKDESGNELFNFCPSTCGFVDGTVLHTYPAATISHPDFKLNTVYHFYLDGKQLGYTGTTKTSGRGDHSGSSSTGTMKTDFIMTKNMMYFSGIAQSS